MSGHGHGHGHGHNCGCAGEHEPAERGLEYGLYQRIDMEKLQCLNESRDGDGKLVFKPWDQRNERDKVTAAQSLTPGTLGFFASLAVEPQGCCLRGVCDSALFLLNRQNNVYIIDLQGLCQRSFVSFSMLRATRTRSCCSTYRKSKNTSIESNFISIFWRPTSVYVACTHVFKKGIAVVLHCRNSALGWSEMCLLRLLWSVIKVSSFSSSLWYDDRLQPKCCISAIVALFFLHIILQGPGSLLSLLILVLAAHWIPHSCPSIAPLSSRFLLRVSQISF